MSAINSTVGQLEAQRSPAHIGAVHLNVRDLDSVAGFYETALGLHRGQIEPGRVSLATGDGTVLVELHQKPDLTPVDPAAPGLFHTAFLLPSRRDLANWLTHAQGIGLRIEGASDHLVSEAMYLSDPEGNGIEIYVDRPRESWPMEGSGVKMATLRLDGPSLMAEADTAPQPWTFPDSGRVGHIHLKVGDLATAESFYRDELGLTVMARYPGAVFMGWGGYHHHVAINVWASRGQPPRAAMTAGLDHFEIAATKDQAMDTRSSQTLTDPAGNRVTFAA